MPTIIFQDNTYTSTAKLRDVVKERIYTLPRYTDFPLSSPDGDFFSELLTFHPEPDRKLINGISGFRIVTNSDMGYFGSAPCVCVVAEDKSSLIDFSWNSCCKYPFAKDSTTFRDQQTRVILRDVVKPQIDAFRKQHYLDHGNRYISDYSGKILDRSDVHIDHDTISFKDLADQWLATVDRSKLKFLESATEDKTAHRLNEPYESQWKDFHQHNAHLQLVSTSENLSDLKKVRGY